MSNKMTGVVAAGLGVLVAIGLVLLVMNLTGGGDGTALTVASSTTVTTAGPTTTLPPATTVTTSPPATAVTTTTAAATTTTAAPFTGDLSAKNCPTSGTPNAAMVTDIRVGEHAGYTRIVFDFSGDVPACYVNQLDPNTISVLVWGVSWTTPFADGIFDGSGILEVDVGSVDRVRDGGMGGGSGEWTFLIHTNTGNRPFSIFTLDGPARLAIDIGD